VEEKKGGGSYTLTPGRCLNLGHPERFFPGGCSPLYSLALRLLAFTKLLAVARPAVAVGDA
jgi:hypothetical protein